jgi:aminopeptidase N
MAENFLTLPTFQKGVSNYLKNKAFGNAERDELWAALTEAAVEDNRLPPEVTVKYIMDGWTLQPGYPVLTVENADEHFVKMSQKRFFLNPNATSQEELTWAVPVNVAYPKSEKDNYTKTVADNWMLKSARTINLELEERPYVVNVQQTGYYRVNYDERNWKELAELLKSDHTKINELNRAQILDDSLQLARANHLSYEVALGLTEYLSQEMNYIPWQAAFKSFSFIDLMLNDNSSLVEYGHLKNYLTKMLTPLFTTLGFESQENDDHLTVLSRKSVLTWLCKFGQEQCVTNSTNLFAEWMKNATDNKIDANLREVVYSTAIRQGGEEEWEFLWQRFLEETVDSERLKLIYTLGVSKNETSILKYLNETLYVGENVRLQDVVYIYRSIGAYAPGRRFQFDWLKSNWDEIKEEFEGRFDDYMFNMISGYAAAANTEAEIDLLEEFLEEKTPELGSIISDIKRSIETAKINLKWTVDNKKVVADWLESRDKEEEEPEPSGASSIRSFSGILFTILSLSLVRFLQ